MVRYMGWWSDTWGDVCINLCKLPVPTLFRYTIGVFPISSVTLEAILTGGLEPLLLGATDGASETGAWQLMPRCICWVRTALQTRLE